MAEVRSRLICLAIYLAAVVTGNAAQAQWTVTNLNPASSHVYSLAFGVDGSQQVGYITNSTASEHASLWSGSAASWVDLNPPGSMESIATAVSDGQQVGGASINGPIHACLWTGTAASIVDLNPAGSSGSGAMGVSDGQQVGSAEMGGGPSHAVSGRAPRPRGSI